MPHATRALRTALALGIALLAGLPALGQDADPLLNVDPQLQDAARMGVEAGKLVDLSPEGLEKTRAMMVAAPFLDDVPVEKVEVPGAEGAPPVTVYVINGREGASRPGILQMHGGGMTLGSAEAAVASLQPMAKDNDWVIVAVDYRLAPETTYQGQTADTYAALRWMHANPARLGLDPDKIAVLGDSAGGLHAALLSIKARDEGAVPLAAQVLIYPALDDRTGSTVELPSVLGRVLWTAPMTRQAWTYFLGMEPGGPDVPAAAVPARVADLSGLPPTFIGVGSLDLFVAEDTDYARRLAEAGVPVDLLVVSGAFHAFDALAPDAPVTQRFRAAYTETLKRAFD